MLDCSEPPTGGVSGVSEAPVLTADSGYAACCEMLRRSPAHWLVTGAAGFIGSHLVEKLLRLGQSVVGLDDFSTGHHRNLEEVRAAVGPDAWQRFRLIEGSVADAAACRRAAAGAQYILHQAALASVPRSLDDPVAANEANVSGFLNILEAARQMSVRRVVYASSSAVYGDDPAPAKTENQVGRMLSPYAVSKAVDELYAGVFFRAYGLESVGLRYFNVFGPRQDPRGAYAAVIPRWILMLLSQQAPVVYGDGESSRDFCPVADVVQANLLAATTRHPGTLGNVFNVGGGRRTTLKELYALLLQASRRLDPEAPRLELRHEPFRPGDIRDSLADISRAREQLGFSPLGQMEEALTQTLAWYAWKNPGREVPSFRSVVSPMNPVAC